MTTLQETLMKKAITLSALLALTSIMAMTAANVANASTENENCVQVVFSYRVSSGGEQMFKAGYSVIEVPFMRSEEYESFKMPAKYILISSSEKVHYQKRNSLGQIVNFFTAFGLDYTTTTARANMKINSGEFKIAEAESTSRYSENDSQESAESAEISVAKKVISYIKKNKINACK